MRKTFLALILWGTLIFSLAACTVPPAVSFSETTPDPTDAPTENAAPEHADAEVLRLEDYRNNPISLDYEDGSLLNTKSIDLHHSALQEQAEGYYHNESELDTLVQYIQDDLHVKIDNCWKVFVHYYDGDKTVGMVQFIYTVGEINTNRSILFNINGSSYDRVSYKCLTGELDEATLRKRVSQFKKRYVQGKRVLQEGEAFCEEKTAFTYFIHSDTLVYSYAYFFQYGEGVINNDWGTERIIDKNGCGVIPFSFEADRQNHPAGEPGVKTEGFVNITPRITADSKTALDYAKQECTVPYDTVAVAYDFTADIWRVDFSTFDLVGNCQSVYLNSDGITRLIVYGE